MISLREIPVYAFEGWPDHGVTELDHLFALIKELDDVRGPVLVHCRGGLGRSGTFNTCRFIYKLFKDCIEKNNPLPTLDAAELVEELRGFRINAVQTPEQFVMIKEFIGFLKGLHMAGKF